MYNLNHYKKPKDQTCWQKIYDNFTELYQNDINVALQNLHYQDIDTFYNDIVSIITKSADDTLPKAKFNKHA